MLVVAFAIWSALLCDLAAAHGTMSAPVVEVTAHRFRAGKPPLVRHSFDVTLRNPAAEPRWIVLPMTFPYTGRDDPKPGGEVSVVESRKDGLVQASSANFQAVRLPPHGSATLRDVAIESWWEGFPPSVELEVMVARAITVGGVPLQDCPRRTSEKAATVKFDVESRARISVNLK